MNTNKHESIEKVVVSVLEHTTQNRAKMLKTKLRIISKNALSCISRLSRVKNIRVHPYLSVVPNSFSVSSVYSVVKNGGAL